MALHKYVSLVLLFIPGVAAAQSYAEIQATYPLAIETTVTGDYTYVYETPFLATTIEGRGTSNIAGRYDGGREVLAYRREGDFYAVATPEEGHLGYILITALDVPQEEGLARAPAVLRDYKSPRTARTLSFVFPGAGHLYAGNTSTGGLLMAFGAASLIGGYAATAGTEAYQCDDVLSCEKKRDSTGLLVGLGAYALAWTYGVLTAPAAARRYNESLDVTARARIVPSLQGASVRPALAMQVRW